MPPCHGHVPLSRLAGEGAAAVGAAGDDGGTAAADGVAGLSWDELAEFRALAASLAPTWADADDGTPPSHPAKRVRLNPAIATAVAAGDVDAAVPAWPCSRTRTPTPPPPPSSSSLLLPADRAIRDRVRAVLATADTAATSVAAVRRRVAREGGGSARVPGRVVRAVVEEVMGEEEEGRHGVRVLVGGGGGGGGASGGRRSATDAVALPAGLAADDVAAYLLARDEEGGTLTSLLTPADELALPFAPDKRDGVAAAALRVVDALTAAGAPAHAAIDGARVAHAAAAAGLRAAWVASHKRGRGGKEAWAALFRPPPGPGEDGQGGAVVQGGGTVHHPAPRRRVVAVPRGRGAEGCPYAPRHTRAFARPAGRRPPAVTPPPHEEDATLAAALDGLPADAAVVLDRAVGAGVRAGVVSAAAARLKRGR